MNTLVSLRKNCRLSITRLKLMWVEIKVKSSKCFYEKKYYEENFSEGMKFDHEDVVK